MVVVGTRADYHALIGMESLFPVRGKLNPLWESGTSAHACSLQHHKYHSAFIVQWKKTPDMTVRNTLRLYQHIINIFHNYMIVLGVILFHSESFRVPGLCSNDTFCSSG